MDDLSNFIRQGFQKMHQDVIEKTYKQKTVQYRREDTSKIRRRTRDTLMYQRRNIDVNNMTPICTPLRENKESKPEDDRTNKNAPKINKRLEMLKKWKAEKEKKKLENKKNEKPLFKVYHVPITVGLPNLENVNKEIKGKSIVNNQGKFVSKFAPENHIFHVPKNINSVKLKITSEKPSKSNIRTKTTFLRAKTSSKTNDKQTKPVFASKPSSDKDLSKKVAWGAVNIFDSDDEVLTQDIKTKTKQKMYNKTPIKKRSGKKSGTEQRNPPQELKEIRQSSSESSFSSEGIHDIHSSKSKRQTRKLESRKPKKFKRSVDECFSPGEGTLYITLRSRRLSDVCLPNGTQQNEVKNKLESGNNFVFNSDEDVGINPPSKRIRTPTNKTRSSTRPDKSILYEDEEMTLKTPTRRRRSASKSTGKYKKNYDDQSSDEDMMQIPPKNSSTPYNRETILISRGAKKRNRDKYNSVVFDNEKMASETDNRKSVSKSTEKKANDQELPRTSNKIEDNLILFDDDEMTFKAPRKSITKSVERKQKRNKGNNNNTTVLFNDEETVSNTSPKKSYNRKSILPLEENTQEPNLNTTYDKADLFDDEEEMPKTPTKREMNKPNKSVFVDEKTLKTPAKNSTPFHRKSVLKSVENTSSKDEVVITKSSSKKEMNRTNNKSVLFDDERALKTPSKKSSANQKSVLKSVENHSSNSATVNPKTPNKKDSQNLRKSLLKSVEKTQNEEPTVYISPFVTLSRGKESARKEYWLRLSNGGTVPDTPEFDKKLTKNTSPTAAAGYFKKLLGDEIIRIEDLCAQWTQYKEEVPEGIDGMIDAAIGQSHLLMAKKFHQFRNLIRLCEDGIERDKPVTCTDLHGYWDTMYMQVEDIDKRFERLRKLRENNWREVLITESQPIEDKTKVIQKRGRGRPKKVVAQSRIKDMIKNQRMRKINGTVDFLTTVDVVNGGSDQPSKVKDSVHNKNVKDSAVSGSCSRVSLPKVGREYPMKSLRVSVISKETEKRTSSSPGLTMMKVSQSFKYDERATPSKSILKSDNYKRENNRMSKTVLFKDLEEEKENVDDVSSCEPGRLRRSRRCSSLN